MSLVRIDLGQMFPPFAQKAIEIQTACAMKGAHYYMTSGNRSWTEQAALYAQGRTKPGNVVTKARPGQSMHNFGLAVDYTLDGSLALAGLQPSWKSSDYSLLGVEAQKAGMTWGGSWTSIVDLPHVEWPLPAGWTLETLRKLYAEGGLTKVWAAIGAKNA